MAEKKRFLDRVLNFMGIEETAAAVEDTAPQRARVRTPVAEPLPVPAEDSWPAGERNGSLRSVGGRRPRVVVIRPQGFEDVQAVADHLKNDEPVILSLEHTRREISKRIIDFVSGATYALDGHIQRLNDEIFLLVPNGVEIDGRLRLPGVEEGTDGIS